MSATSRERPLETLDWEMLDWEMLDWEMLDWERMDGEMMDGEMMDLEMLGLEMLSLEMLDWEMLDWEMMYWEMMDGEMLGLEMLDLEMMDFVLILEAFLPGEGIQREGTSVTSTKSGGDQRPEMSPVPPTPQREGGTNAQSCPQGHQSLPGFTFPTPWEAQGAPWRCWGWI